VREKKNENEDEDEDENEGPRTNRRGEVLMSTVEMGRRGGKEPKRVKGAAGALALFDTFASDDSAPFAVPPPLSQRALSAQSASAQSVSWATMAATAGRSDNNNKKHLSLLLEIYQIFRMKILTLIKDKQRI
jgi:hypothetical protein